VSDEAGGFELSDEQRSLLSSVLDQVVPSRREGRMPGAGELGLADKIEQAARQDPGFGDSLVKGLAAIVDLAGERDPGGFDALSSEAKLEVLNEVTTGDPGLIPGIAVRTYMAYYTNDRVVEALGLEPRPPHPEGYVMEPSDLSLLDEVRRRPKLYREC